MRPSSTPQRRLARTAALAGAVVLALVAPLSAVPAQAATAPPVQLVPGLPLPEVPGLPGLGDLCLPLPGLPPPLGCPAEPPAPVFAPDTAIDSQSPQPNAENWVGGDEVTITFSASYAEGEEPTPAAEGQPEPTTTFECRIAGPTSRDWAPCTSPHTFSGLADTNLGDASDVYTASVRATLTAADGRTARDQSPATTSFRLDGTPPAVLIVREPTLTPRTASGQARPYDYLLDNRTNYAFQGIGGAVGFECTLDGTRIPCPSAPSDSGNAAFGEVELTRLAAGDHDFSVVAVDQAGNRSRQAQTRTFHVPFNRFGTKKQIDRAWTRAAGSGFYLNDYVLTRTKGAVLSRRFTNFREVSLLVARGPQHGRIRVTLGGTRLRVANLAANRRSTLEVLPVKLPADRAFSGVLKVEVISPDGQTVMIDGIAVR